MADTWQWNPGPPGPQTVQAGTRLDFRLPLEGQGPPPVCEWTVGFAGLHNQAPSDDPLRLVLDIPSDEHGFKKIQYKVHTEPPLTGVLHVRILPQEQDQGSGPGQEPKKDPPEISQDQPHPESSSQDPSHPYTSDPTQTQPLPAGTYQIHVYKEKRRTLQLRLDPKKSCIVGKQSVTKGVIPDIDLTPLFTDPQEAKKVSREQLKVYWQEGKIVLRNTGKNAISGDNGQIESQAKHFWQPGERLYLPGSLSLLLIREE